MSATQHALPSSPQHTPQDTLIGRRTRSVERRIALQE